MDIKSSIKEKLEEYLFVAIPLLLSSLFVIVASLLGQLGLQQKVARLSSILLFQLDMYLLAICLFLGAWIVYLYSKNKKKLILHENLYWSAKDATPFCVPCKDIFGKLVHMKSHKYWGTKAKAYLTIYICPSPSCNYRVDHATHPTIKKK